MNLQNYLRTEGLEKLVRAYSIKVNRHSDFDNLICLKYSQVESPMGEKIVQQCRGIILDEKNNYEVVSYPFDKFFNYGEINAPTLDWNTAKVFDKLDGSLMTLYFYQDEWRVQSSGMADAIGEVNGFDFSFAELFWQVWQELNYELPKNTDLCFMYELCTKFNRIVVRQHANNLILHGIRNIKTLKEVHLDDYQEHNWNVVDTYELNNLEDIVANCNQLDPMESEGYIVCDRNFNRIKVKSPEYVAIAHFRDSFSPRRMLQIIRANEGEEFLSYYPEWQELFDEIKAKFNRLKAEIESTYAQHSHIENQKEFALAIKELPYAGLIFNLRKNKINSIAEGLKETTIQKLESLLEIC